LEVCYYGCGQEAKYQFKNGRWCCSDHYRKCPEFIKKIKGLEPWNKGLKNCYSEETLKKQREKIPWNKGKTGIYSEETKIKMGKSKKGIKKIVSNETKKKLSKSLKGRIFSEEWKKKISDSKVGKSLPPRSEKEKENYRERMLNGGAVHALRFMKKISKPEIELREIIKDMYNNCQFQYPVLNYALDIAIPEYKIAIEYDGYFHFSSEDKIKYHKERQEKIENEGWKFIRYNIFQKFPSKEIVKNDIENIIEGVFHG